MMQSCLRPAWLPTCSASQHSKHWRCGAWTLLQPQCSPLAACSTALLGARSVSGPASLPADSAGAAAAQAALPACAGAPPAGRHGGSGAAPHRLEQCGAEQRGIRSGGPAPSYSPAAADCTGPWLRRLGPHSTSGAAAPPVSSWAGAVRHSPAGAAPRGGRGR